jgi:carbamoyltransferase
MPPSLGGREEILESYAKSSSFKRKYIIKGLKKTPIMTYYLKKTKKERIKALTKMNFKEEKINFIEHHMAHANSAYFGSPWSKDEKILILTNDGAGDDLCATVNIGLNGKIERKYEIHQDESIAWYYAMVTFFMGMVPMEHEYKVMGLAPYCSEYGRKIGFEIFSKMIQMDKKPSLSWHRLKNVPPAQYSIEYVSQILKRVRFDIIAAGIQKWVEELLIEWTKRAVNKYDIKKVAFGGGIFMNVKANKRISEIPEIEDVFIFPSCGDESNAIGSAFAFYSDICQKEGRDTDIPSLKDIYFGPSILNKEIEHEMDKHKNINISKENDIDKTVGELLSNNKIVARSTGRMEFGARALGNRSILAHPKYPENIRIINDIIKNRDFWMPFAPVVLYEREKEYIKNPKNIFSPYMMMAFNSTEKIDDFKAGTHPYDLTARPQSLKKEYNPEYYKILKTFSEKSGQGILLNTSFNLHGFPIVCNAKEAFEVFFNSGLNYLAMNDYLFSKK